MAPTGTSSTTAQYVKRLGLRPAQFGRFVDWPFSRYTLDQLEVQARQVAAERADFFVTLQPQQGLETVTPASAEALARLLRRWNEDYGLRVYVRFAHEMNGNWTVWGQRPKQYVRAFRALADAVHRLAPGNPLVWSPNYGDGYPFSPTPLSPPPGSGDFLALDTNADGVLDMRDDPYGPYYPGDRYVDWVGLTLYYHGYAWPWLENEVPEPDRFVRQMRGEYHNPLSDQRPLEDFYRIYAEGHDKPMALSETGAFFNASRAGEGYGESAIKQGWMRQIFSAQTARLFPKLKMINWFEYAKDEAGINGVDAPPERADWRATYEVETRDALRSYLEQGHFRLASR